MAEIQGKDIVLLISTDLVTPSYKTLICLETLSINHSKGVTKRETRCGTKIGLGVAELVISGTSIADDDPDTDEVSHQDMEGWLHAGTKVLLKAAHVSDPTKYFVGGEAYVTSLDETAPSDNTLDYNFQFDVTGEVDLTP